LFGIKAGCAWARRRTVHGRDCVFNWEYARDPGTAAITIGRYQDVSVEKLDRYTVKVTFPKPRPFWASVFVSDFGMLIPKHLFKDYVGSKSREAPANLQPVGTGPYKFVEFVPGDIVIGELNSSYYVENRPYFDSFELKGGGDAVSAARAVLQTGEYDYA
jgi:peptide/nickel transport system substrate-binding protein